MSAYGVTYTVAVAIGVGWSLYRLTKADFPRSSVIRGMAMTLWGGIVGGYLFHTALSFFPGLFPRGLISNHLGPSTIIGVILGGALTGAWETRRSGLPLGKVFDVGCLPLPLSQAIGRVGCFFAGCCFGQPTAGPFAMVLPGLHGRPAPRYPTQLISAAVNLGILGILLAVEHRRRKRSGDDWPFEGFIFLLWVALFSCKRFILEFIRGTASPVLLGLTWAQVATGTAFLAALAAIAVNLRRKNWIGA